MSIYLLSHGPELALYKCRPNGSPVEPYNAIIIVGTLWRVRLMGRLERAEERSSEALSQLAPSHIQLLGPELKDAAKAQNTKEEIYSHLWRFQMGSFELPELLFRSNYARAPGIRRLKGGAV
jgi:hypothetical protein